ncbi:YqkE family protein [Bacillus massiliglaciei]|uniref:YqkE family protein n=1 Tax=Bacillus massiliglaciei TaxID=1816693 RepID=UPI000AE6F9B9|nr:YqkE family protein [Bacillus massiliglaciei]
MKKRKQTHSPGKRQKDESLTLGDVLNQDIMAKLKETQKQLTEAEQEKRAAEEARKREERKQREKNKSFEELLGESSLDWKQYK